MRQRTLSKWHKLQTTIERWVKLSSFEFKCTCGKKYVIDTLVTDCDLIERSGAPNNLQQAKTNKCLIEKFMDKNEAVGVLKTIIDFEDSDYIKEALEMALKALQAPESVQMAYNKQNTP